MKKKIYSGLVWSGFMGEYKHPPIYIIPPSDEIMEDGIFVSDIFKKYINKTIRVTIEVITIKEISKMFKVKDGWGFKGQEDGSVIMFKDDRVVITFSKDDWISIITHVVRTTRPLDEVYELAKKLHGKGTSLNEDLIDLLDDKSIRVWDPERSEYYDANITGRTAAILAEDIEKIFKR